MREIHVDETEPSAVAESPLEIVEQRPHEKTADRYARVDRIEHRPEITAQIGDPRLVADPAVSAIRSANAAPFSRM